MLRHAPAKTATLILAATTGLQPVFGQDPNGSILAGTGFSAELGAGLEYDSNVSVDEVDVSSSQSDHALSIDGELQYRRAVSGFSDITLSYDFSQYFYQEFSEVDRQTHILGADWQLDAGPVDTGLYGYYINARLDGNAFLEQYRLSPYLSGFIGKKWYGRVAYVYADKTIENRPERDASTNSVEGDLYFFMRGLRSYLNVGYRFKDEHANGARYAYDSHALKLRYVHRFDLFDRLSKLELAWRFEDRDYRGIDPSIGERRADDRQRWQAEFEVPIAGRLKGVLYYGYSDYQSNLPRADYNRNVLGARFAYSW